MFINFFVNFFLTIKKRVKSGGCVDGGGIMAQGHCSCVWVVVLVVGESV